MSLHRNSMRVRRLQATALVGLFAALPLASPTLAFQTPKDVTAHVLRRISFGPVPGQADALSVNFPADLLTHVNAQIDGNLPEDPAYTFALTQFGVPADSSSAPAFGSWDIEDLAAQQIFRMCYSENQLRELMTLFWQQHFNTNYNKARGFFIGNPGLTSGLPGSLSNTQKGEAAAAYVEFLQNEAFRANALGEFRQLVGASGQGPAMLIFLDSHGNNVPPGLKPNENYIREFWELHTLGVSLFTGFNYRYTGADIDTGAFAFTGWQVAQNTTTPPNGVATWELGFNPANHTDATGLVLPNMTLSIPAFGQFDFSSLTGQAQGDGLFDYMSDSIETRVHVCSKLIEFFVGFRPADPTDPSFQTNVLNYPTTNPNFENELTTTLVNCVGAWDDPAPGSTTPMRGNIAAVVRTILLSQSFSDASVYWGRLKNHIEYFTSVVRAYNPDIPLYGAGEFTTVLDHLENDLRHELFRFPSPDGFPQESDEQISTNSQVYRLNIARTVNRNFLLPDPTGNLNGYAAGEIDWYYLRSLLPGLLTSGTDTQKIFALLGYLQTYPPAPGTFLDMGVEQDVVDHVFELLFQSDAQPASNALAVSFLQTLSATNPTYAGQSIGQLMVASHPNAPNFVAALTEHGQRMTQFKVYAASLPQFQTK